MPEATAIALPPLEETTLLDRGKVGVICLIFTEIALFSIFLTAYVFYIGKILNGPYPKDVLTLPIWATVCLLSSSLTVEMAIRSLRRHQPGAFKLWLGLTILLGASLTDLTRPATFKAFRAPLAMIVRFAQISEISPLISASAPTHCPWSVSRSITKDISEMRIVSRDLTALISVCASSFPVASPYA